MAITIDGTSGISTPGLTDSGNLSVAGTTTLTTQLGVAQGGTGAATLTANNVLLGNGTSAVQVVAPGTAGNVLTSNGTTWSSTAPATTGFTTIGPTTITGTTAQTITGISATAKYVVVNYSSITSTSSGNITLGLVNASGGGSTLGASYKFTGGNTVTTAGSSLSTTYRIWDDNTGTLASGQFIFSLINSSTNLWAVSGFSGNDAGGTSLRSTMWNGSQPLSAAISGITLTPSAGTMSGTVTIQYM
jgi:hypothetical protein